MSSQNASFSTHLSHAVPPHTDGDQDRHVVHVFLADVLVAASSHMYGNSPRSRARNAFTCGSRTFAMSLTGLLRIFSAPVHGPRLPRFASLLLVAGGIGWHEHVVRALVGGQEAREVRPCLTTLV